MIFRFTMLGSLGVLFVTTRQPITLLLQEAANPISVIGVRYGHESSNASVVYCRGVTNSFWFPLAIAIVRLLRLSAETNTYILQPFKKTDLRSRGV